MRVFKVIKARSFISLLLASFIVCSSAMAMPFNTDMFEVQPSTDAVARKKPAGSVSIGSLERIKPDLNTAWVQKNPFTGSMESVDKGLRGFQKNCSVCHGAYDGNNAHIPSDLMLKGIPSIDLSSEAVRFNDPGTNQKPKNDAHFFTYVFNGGVLMPAYGYKLSNAEIWDIVSYIREIQLKASNKKAAN